MKQFKTPTILFIIVFSIYFLCGCSSTQQYSHRYHAPAFVAVNKPPVEKEWRGQSNLKYIRNLYSNLPDGKPWRGWPIARDRWTHEWRDDIYWRFDF